MSLVRRHNARPVDGEQLAQVGGEFDEVGLYDALGDEVDNSQQQERLVRGAEFGCCRQAGRLVSERRVEKFFR